MIKKKGGIENFPNEELLLDAVSDFNSKLIDTQQWVHWFLPCFSGVFDGDRFQWLFGLKCHRF